MVDSSPFALAGVLTTMAVNLGGFLVAWGAMKGALRALDRRVDALEAELATVTELKVAVAEVKTTLAFLLEQVRELNATLRWEQNELRRRSAAEARVEA